MNNFKHILLLISIILVFTSISSVAAHDTDYPNVVIEKPISNSDVSGSVEIVAKVDDHHETQYVNFTIDGVDNPSYNLKNQDKNPSDGWKYIWDTSKVDNGKYYIQARAINNVGLKGEYNILVTVANTQKNTILSIENTTIGVNQNCNIVVGLTDKDNKPLYNKEIMVNIDGKEEKITTNKNGVGTVSYSNSKVGNYNINAKFLGDKLYSPSNAKGVVNVIPLNIVQTYGSYIGGNGNDKGKGVYVDSIGNIYLAMETSSTDLDTSPKAYQKVSGGGKDLFITKFSPKGELIFSTYLGGSKTEMQKDLKVDKDGNIYIVGFTQSPDLNVTSNAIYKNITWITIWFFACFK